MWVPVPVLRMVEHRGSVSRGHLRRHPVWWTHRRLIRQVGPAAGSSSSPCTSRRRRPRRSHRRNVAVGAPAVDHRVRVLHCSLRRLRVPENHEAVALGAAGLAIGDDDGLEYFAVALEVLAQPVGRRLPRQAAHEHLGQRRVTEPRPVVVRPAAAASRRRVGRGTTGGGRRRSSHLQLARNHAPVDVARTCRLRLVPSPV
uniref:Uncharacterized protein n=1 Tax=Arundo donax TaxID=35708 RepID=A0A0A9DA22_ARUDO